MTATRKRTGGSPARTVNLWPRRLITGLALLAVVALVAVGVHRLAGVLGGTAPGHSGDTAAAQSGRSEEDPQSGPGLNDATSGAAGLSSVIIDACTANDFAAQIQAPAAISVGKGASVSMTLTSRSLPDCSMTQDRMALRVVSGDQVIFDGSGCPPPDSESGTGTLLFATGFQWSGTLTWDGRVHDGCRAIDTDGDGQPDVAGAGIYRLQVLIDGSRIGDPAIVEVR